MALTNSINERWTDRDLGGVTQGVLTAEDTDARTMSFQFYDRAGRDMQRMVSGIGYISSDPTGATLEAASSTLSVAAGTDGVVGSLSASNVAGLTIFKWTTEADGDLDITVTQTSGADLHYINLCLPNGDIFTSTVLTFAA
ncbi:MAG: hypothetical protein ABT940_13125 [Alphaproteobacteria bacterium]